MLDDSVCFYGFREDSLYGTETKRNSSYDTEKIILP